MRTLRYWFGQRFTRSAGRLGSLFRTPALAGGDAAANARSARTEVSQPASASQIMSRCLVAQSSMAQRSALVVNRSGSSAVTTPVTGVGRPPITPRRRAGVSPGFVQRVPGAVSAPTCLRGSGCTLGAVHRLGHDGSVGTTSTSDGVVVCMPEPTGPCTPRPGQLPPCRQRPQSR